MVETPTKSPANCNFTLGYIAEFVGAQLRGDNEVVISGLATLTNARAGQLAFLANPQFRKYLSETQASAVILSAADAEAFTGHALLSDKPYLTFAKVTALFAPTITEPAIHPSAVIDPTAVIEAGVTVGANAVVEAKAVIGRGSRIGPCSVIGAGSVIGEQANIAANVSIYHGVRIGKRAIIHSAVVVGSDGFGFAPDGSNWVKIHQLGGVVIGDDVELGAATCIDRGALDDTVIGNGVKTDNLVHVAHNVVIGDNTLMCGCSGVAGSSRIGANCTIGGAVGIINHLTIADGVTVTAGTLVTKSIHTAGVYSSGTPLMTNSEWRKNAATFPRLYSLYQQSKRLNPEKKGKK